MVEISTVTVSEALKQHLHEIKQNSHDHSVEDVNTLHGAMEWLLDEGHDEKISVEGYEETLDEPVKVPMPLFNRVRKLREKYNCDSEKLLRDRGNIKSRELGEQPVDVDWPPEE